MEIEDDMYVFTFLPMLTYLSYNAAVHATVQMGGGSLRLFVIIQKCNNLIIWEISNI